MTGVLTRRSCKDTGTQTHREGHVIMEVETGMIQLQAKDDKDCQ